MKKSVFFLITMLLMSMLYVSCIKEVSYPFRDIAQMLIDGMTDMNKNGYDRHKEKLIVEKADSMLNEMEGLKISMEAEDGIGVEVVDDNGIFKKGKRLLGIFTFPIHFELKVTDADDAATKLDRLCVVFYNDNNDAVYMYHGIGDDVAGVDVEIDMDSVAIDSTEVVESAYSKGQILQRRIQVSFGLDEMPLFVNVTKAVVEPWDIEKERKIEERAKAILQEFKQQQKSIQSDNGSNFSLAEQDQANKPVNNELGRGELGIFDLRGLVKSCTWKTPNGTMTYTFDKNGFWLTQNGSSLKSIFAGGIERDNQKRVKDCWADGYGSVHYKYNSKGQATNIDEDGFNRKLTYDSEGYVVREVQELAPEMGDDEGEPEITTLQFTILEKDNVGNWTKRKSSRGTETRTITYF